MNPNVLVTNQIIASIAAEANVAVGVVFGLIKAVRDNWPFNAGETPIPDAELIASSWAKASCGECKRRLARSAAAVITMAFLPLVSACRASVGFQPRNSRAVSQAPVRITPSTSGCVISR